MARRKLVFMWLLYGLCALILAVLQTLLFTRIRLWGMHPFVLPCIGAVIATYEDRRSSIFFAFFLGFLCDLIMPAPLPCVYMVSFSLSALWSALLTRRAVVPGLVSSLTVSALALALNGFLQVLVLFYLRGSVFVPGLLLLLRELAVSLPTAILVHLFVARIHRYLARV